MSRSFSAIETALEVPLRSANYGADLKELRSDYGGQFSDTWKRTRKDIREETWKDIYGHLDTHFESEIEEKLSVFLESVQSPLTSLLRIVMTPATTTMMMSQQQRKVVVLQKDKSATTL